MSRRPKSTRKSQRTRAPNDPPARKGFFSSLENLVGRTGAVIISIGTILGCALIVSVLAWNFWTDSVFVNDVELRAEAQGGSIDGDTLLEGALAAMPSSLARDASRLRAAPFLSLIEKVADGYLPARVCNSILDVGGTADWLHDNVRSSVMSSRTLDAVATPGGTTLRKLAFVLRRSLSAAPREVRPILTKEGSNHVLTINLSPPVFDADGRQVFIRRTFAEESLATSELSSALGDVFAPDLRAAKLASAGEPVNSEHLAIALQFLEDKQRFLYTLLSIASGSHTNQADQFAYAYHYEPVVRGIYEGIDFSRFGDKAVLIKSQIATILQKAEIYKINMEGKDIVPSELFSAFFEKIVPELEESLAGNVLLAQLYAQHHMRPEFDRKVRWLIEERPEADTGIPISGAEIAVLLSSILISEGFADEAEKVLRSELVGPALGASADGSHWPVAVDAMLASLEAVRGDVQRLARLRSSAFAGVPCAGFAAIGPVLNLAIRGAIKLQPKDAVLDEVLRVFEFLDRSGLASYEFYDGWAHFLRLNGQPSEAMGKYEIALKYKGEQSWGLLNWGYAALEAGEPDVAIGKFLSSLELGVVPNAARGLIFAYARKGLPKETLYSYNAYYNVFLNPGYTRAWRSEIEYIALWASCSLGVDMPRSLMSDGELLSVEGMDFRRDELDMQTCAFKKQ